MNSTMSEEPDALSVVNQLRDLAADPLNRRAIVQDQGCLPGLILFLDHPNPPVVHSALLVSALERNASVSRTACNSVNIFKQGKDKPGVCVVLMFIIGAVFKSTFQKLPSNDTGYSGGTCGCGNRLTYFASLP